MQRRSLGGAAALLALSAVSPVMALAKDVHGVMHSPPGGTFQPVSKLVKLPDFLPGLGSLYVDPKTLPAGPFLAYDHQGRLASTIYMIPLKDLNAQQAFPDLPAPGGRVDHVSLYFNAGHPGVQEPHYHIVLWHITKAEQVRVAK